MSDEPTFTLSNGTMAFRGMGAQSYLFGSLNADHLADALGTMSRLDRVVLVSICRLIVEADGA